MHDTGRTRLRSWHIARASDCLLSSRCHEFGPNRPSVRCGESGRQGWFRERLHVGWGFPDSSVGKESTAVRETCVRSLGWEDLLEKG